MNKSTTALQLLQIGWIIRTGEFEIKQMLDGSGIVAERNLGVCRNFNLTHDGVEAAITYVMNEEEAEG